MLEQVKVTLVEAEVLRMKKFLRDKVVSIREGLRDLYDNKVVMWRKAYEAIPAQAIREFPFHGASNLIVPVIAIHADTLLARVMAAVFKTMPVWTAKLVGDYDDPKRFEDMRIAFETHMQYVAIEPTELDLYRVYHEWFGETIRLGTSTIKCPWIKDIEDLAITAADGIGSVDYYKKLRYEGSRPEKIPFVDFGIPPSSRTIESARFKYHRIHLQKDELEEKAYIGIYDKTAVKEILGKPDRESPSTVQQSQEQDTGARTLTGYGFEEYDIYECHYRYKLGRKYVNLVAWYNERNDQILRIYHNYYPDDVFVTARLFYRDDFFFGYGFAETLASFQEEISQIHNQRRDNSTVSNMKMWRVDPDSELHKGYRTFPGATVPARKDEIEGLSCGEVNPLTIEEEQLSLELAEKRSGVSAPLQGMGSGAMTKRGVYSSMGTLSLMQEGNTRTDLNVTDIRYAHTKLGRIIAKQEAEFGSDDSSRYKRYGKMGSLVQQALQAYKDGVITLPVYAATASVNREVEKQSDLMLSGLMQKHHQMIAQMLGAAANQFTPPEVKKYMTDAVESANALMKSVFRHFGYDEVDRYVPDAQPPAQGTQPPEMGGGPGGAPQLPPVSGAPPALQPSGQQSQPNPLSAVLTGGNQGGVQ